MKLRYKLLIGVVVFFCILPYSYLQITRYPTVQKARKIAQDLGRTNANTLVEKNSCKNYGVSACRWVIYFTTDVPIDQLADELKRQGYDVHETDGVDRLESHYGRLTAGKINPQWWTHKRKYVDYLAEVFEPDKPDYRYRPEKEVYLFDVLNWEFEYTVNGRPLDKNVIGVLLFYP